MLLLYEIIYDAYMFLTAVVVFLFSHRVTVFLKHKTLSGTELEIKNSLTNSFRNTEK